MDVLDFDEPERDSDRVFFGATLDAKFAMDCLKVPLTKKFEKKMRKYAKGVSKGRKYLDRDYVYEFLGDGLLVKAIHVPCFMYGGVLEMMSFEQEILLAEPEYYEGDKERRILYGVANIPNEESYEDLKKLFGFWAEETGKIV